MSGKCEHGLTTKECLVCASAKYPAAPQQAQETSPTEVHSCSYWCQIPSCIKAQRDELRERLEAQAAQPPQGAGPLTNIAVDVIAGYKAGLAGEPIGIVSEAFDCGWYSGDHERRAAPPQGASSLLPEKYDDVLLPFLALMRRELHANAGKGDRPGWLAMDRKTAVLEIHHHIAKLQKAVLNDDGPAIAEYAADVANMAMMALDVCGGLEVAASPRTDDSAAGSNFEQELRSGGRWSPEMIERVAGAEPAIFNAISAYTPPGTHSATASPLPAPQEPAAEPDHELKTWPPFFDEVLSGRKTFEVRKNDRGFAVGHVVRLNEWAPDKGYTGRFVDKRITYMLTGPQFGIEAGYSVLALYASPAPGELASVTVDHLPGTTGDSLEDAMKWAAQQAPSESSAQGGEKV